MISTSLPTITVLPIVWCAGSPPHDSKSPAAEPEPTGKSPDSIRILIVEDEILVALDTKAMLEANRYIVVGIAVSAAQALHLVESAKPDLVLMDIRLEGARDGIDAASEIRDRFDIPTLFVTAHGDLRTRERAKSARPVGFLVKPFNEASLLRALAGLVL
jgi:CheY-like chemotaxis protein